MHDEQSWHQMEYIKKELGKDIVRVGTEDLGEMEKVRTVWKLNSPLTRMSGHQEGAESID